LAQTAYEQKATGNLGNKWQWRHYTEVPTNGESCF
jgi:hypothetical protein